jgi:hypothetical protein
MARSPAFQRRPPFDRTRALIVRKSFNSGGRLLSIGEPFDGTGHPLRKVRVLYEGGWLRHDDAGTTALASSAPVDDRPFLLHRGFGRYVVMRGDVPIAGPMKRADAEAALAASTR